MFYQSLAYYRKNQNCYNLYTVILVKILKFPHLKVLAINNQFLVPLSMFSQIPSYRVISKNKSMTIYHRVAVTVHMNTPIHKANLLLAAVASNKTVPCIAQYCVVSHYYNLQLSTNTCTCRFKPTSQQLLLEISKQLTTCDSYWCLWPRS